ncbi:hypothetical protein [Clostridium gasigenes]|uniref:hypothetical protein n=1 Tax=Clostridium gasigenes TaxID=94869 RepID=UPI001C0CAC69|nr:hypothetical protein [Clostridium gasigenes]MBU3104175.1 hypothetical protein [Clostridium gasigenes]
MDKDLVSAIELAKELGLYLKIVNSMKSFENYNSFFNIFSQTEEACRRIVVLTPYKELEEVDEENADKPIITNKIIDGNLWLEEYHLTTSLKNICIENIVVSKSLVKELFNK